jgi:hypothetical protein
MRPNTDEVAELLWLSEAEALAHPDGLPTLPSLFDALRDVEDAAP